MKRFASIAAFAASLVFLSLCGSQAYAQQTAKVVSTCGTAGPYTAGGTNYVTVDVNGNSCSAGGGGTPSAPSTVTPTNALSSDASSTVTAGGSYQTALAQNLTRKNCTIQNNYLAVLEPLFVSIASSPTAANSYILNYGDTFSCTSGVVVMGDAIKVSAATTGHTFVETSQ